MIRACRQGYKIGPLFADSVDIAFGIFRALIAMADSGKSIFLDVPEPNEQAKPLIQSFNMHPVFETGGCIPVIIQNA